MSRMKYELYKKEVGIWKDVIFILPTIRVVVDSPVFARKNITISFHFWGFYARLTFLRRVNP